MFSDAKHYPDKGSGGGSGANERIGAAIIGCRTQGQWIADTFISCDKFDLVGLCDCDEAVLNQASTQPEIELAKERDGPPAPSPVVPPPPSASELAVVEEAAASSDPEAPTDLVLPMRHLLRIAFLGIVIGGALALAIYLALVRV